RSPGLRSWRRWKPISPALPNGAKVPASMTLAASPMAPISPRCSTKPSPPEFSVPEVETPMSTSNNGPLRIGIGGPVGSGKTTLCEMLLKAMRDRYSMAVVTNDIYTKEDALILARVQAISEDRIVGVETGGCPHTAIREDASL